MPASHRGMGLPWRLRLDTKVGDSMTGILHLTLLGTVEKSIKQITELSQQQKPNMNQIVRWVNIKDRHADDTANIITYYFMAQRVKPVDKSDAAAYEKYTKQLTLLHSQNTSTKRERVGSDQVHLDSLACAF